MADSDTHTILARTDITGPSLELPILAVGTVVTPLLDGRQRDRLILGSGATAGESNQNLLCATSPPAD